MSLQQPESIKSRDYRPKFKSLTDSTHRSIVNVLTALDTVPDVIIMEQKFLHSFSYLA